MLKLYNLNASPKEYWETWENDGEHTVHWGALGTKGQSKKLASGILRNTRASIQKEVDLRVSAGFGSIDIDDHAVLMIEYTIDGMGTPADLEKRHRLEERMNETLGWTGLGHCDGGSIGSGTMEVCCFVVDFELARVAVQQDLENSEFSDFSRIYDERA